MFTVDEVLANQKFLASHPLFDSPIKAVLRRLWRENEFIAFARQYPHLQGIDFVEQVLEYFHFSYTVSDQQRENIPPAGRLVIVANHPIGSLDGLALLKLIHGVRSDVKILANDLLMHLPALQPCLLPVNNMGGSSSRQQLHRIRQSLANEEAIIIFPAGEVSRLRSSGVKDGPWHRGFLTMANKAQAPILPIHIQGRNSAPFYTASMLCKPLSTVMLIGEMFKQQQKQIKFTVGKIIPHRVYQGLDLSDKEKAKLFHKHIYRLGKGRPGILRSESAIARPERRTELRKELQNAQFLRETPDNKQIYLYQCSGTSSLLREIGRLREITFRAVEEGTGKRRDMDPYDNYYQHLILWDEDDLEIVGAYRLVDSAGVMAKQGKEGLYSHSLFNYGPEHDWFLNQGIELGRSFIQQRYWGRRSLDYLWYGIGALLAQKPHYRYLFGPVSISNSMPQAGKDLLVYFYKLYFGGHAAIHCSRQPFAFSQPVSQLAKQFDGDNYREDLKRLKSMLAAMGSAIPTLYKQYSELCELGGVRFLDFNVDPEFNNCIDGLVVVDLHQLKEKKRQRYISQSILTAA